MKQSLLKLRLFIVSLCLCSGLPALHATAEATEPNGGGYFSEEQSDAILISQPAEVTYERIYGGSSDSRAPFKLSGYDSNMAIRIQLADVFNRCDCNPNYSLIILLS